MAIEPVEIGTYRGIRFHEAGDSKYDLEQALVGRNPKDLRGWYVVHMKPEELAPFRVMSKLHGIHLTDAVLRNGFVREIFKNDPEFVWKEPDPPPSNACTQCGGTGETPSLLGTFASYTCTRCKGSKAELAITPPAVLEAMSKEWT